MAKAYSPRNVEMTSPPRVWGWKWSNRKGTATTAMSAGAGKRRPESRPNAHAATGTLVRLSASTSLNVIVYGRTALNSAITSAGNGK